MDDDCDSAEAVAYISVALIVSIGVAVGASIEWHMFKSAAFSWKAVLIGWCCQFGIMPLYAFGVANIFDYSDAVAIGCILCGSAPGGTSSNLFTMLARGDVALSVVMSAASTLCSFAMVPLLVAIYINTTFDGTDDVKIDYGTIGATLALILIPCAFAMLLRHKNTTKKVYGKFYWEWVEKIFGALGSLLLVGVVVFGLVTQEETLNVGEEIWIPALLLQPIGSTLGYAAAYFAKLDRPSRRAISLETGVQNISYAIAVIALTWKDNCAVQEKALGFPYIASIGYLANSTITVLFFRYVMAPNDPVEDHASKFVQDKETSEEKAGLHISQV